MTNDAFKKLLDAAIRPVNDRLDKLDQAIEPINDRLDKLDAAFKPVNERLDKLDAGLNDLRKELKEVKDTQEQRVLPPLVYIEATLKSYADRYVANEDHIGRLQKRGSTVENKLGIIPPQDLTIPLF